MSRGDKNRTRRTPPPPTEGWDIRPRGNCLIWAIALAAGPIAVAGAIVERLTS